LRVPGVPIMAARQPNEKTKKWRSCGPANEV
jgi:hypothetical protein